MKLDRFDAVASEFIAAESRLLDHKREEYASRDGDVLENFATLATMLGSTRSEVAATYLAKHVQAILKQVSQGSFAWEWATDEGEGLKQRISDARNYLLLLAACIEEDRTEGNAS